jgi:hypothetical protein
MGLKKFRKIKAQDEEYINVSVVCNNYDRINRKNKEVNNNLISSFDCITSPRCANVDSE